MPQKTPGKKIDPKELMEKLSQVDLNDIDFKNAGSWPKAGKISAWAVAVILTAILGHLLYLAPKLSQLEQARTLEKQLLQEYEIKAFQGANLPAYKQQMLDIQQQISSLSVQLPIQSSIPELIEHIGDQAQKYRVDIRGIKLHPERQESAYSAQPLTLSVNGSYHNLALFLSGMTQLERIVTLHDFTLQPSEKQLNLTIETAAYHNKPAEQEDNRE